MKTTPHFQKGLENRIAFVFSCPGSHEAEKGYPAAGRTGKNLELLLEKMNEWTATDDWKREKITITNAWDKIEHIGKTGRTEASDAQIMQSDNLARMVRELAHVEHIIIASGKKAEKAVKAIEHGLKANVIVIVIRHLGMQSINQIQTDVKGNALKTGEKGNTAQRMEVVALELYKNIFPLSPLFNE